MSSMFDALSKSSEPIEQFSTWLLVGTATIASFLIVNSDKLMLLISPKGFLFCGACLCLSCITGFVSKIYALRCKIGIEVGSAIRKTFIEHLNNYENEQKKIQDSASFWGITLETGIRIERVFSEFYKLQPKIVVWITTKLLKKLEGNPQAFYIILVKMLNRQGMYTLLQAIFFLCFLVVGFTYGASI